MTDEKRAFTRALTRMPAVAKLDDGEELVGLTADVSLGGLRLECGAHNASAGQTAVLGIDLSETQQIFMQATIVRTSSEDVALQMTAIDRESAMHLYQLVCHNVTDADVVDEEVRRWLGIDEAC